MKFRTKRIHADPDAEDGRRILIDRLWPRGVSKERAALDYWARDIAPSNDLRRWYQHDPKKWPEFRQRYFAELDANPEGIQTLVAELGQGTNTILFASKELELNNASALVEYLQEHLG